MAKTLTSKFEIKINTTLLDTGDLGNTQDLIQSITTLADLSNGTGINAANAIFHDTRTLASTVTENIDIYDFAGTRDPVGDVYTLARVKVLYVRNKATTAGENLEIGGEGSAAAWNTPFDASDTGKVMIGPGGCLMLINPSAAGWTVTDASNHLLKIENAGAGSIDYDLIIIGANS